GAYQVSMRGDLANWHTNAPDATPAVGGAMDLAVGARHVYIVMELFDKQGRSKLLPQCTYPVTGLQCVDRIYTDVATFEIREDGVYVPELIGDMSFETLQRRLPVPLSR
ncbi:MAG TPA: CoA-transferase, partial [Advenella sp.]|nr:CoA-transferase [Advenella sp.]